jgi:hypothetical protein
MGRTVLSLLLSFVLAEAGRAAEPPGNVEKLVGALRETEAGSEAWDAAVAAGKPAILELQKLLKEAAPWVRARAAILLYRLGEASALDALAGLVGSEDEEAATEAAAALRAFVGAPVEVDPAATGAARDMALSRWTAWWQANRQQVLGVSPMSRLYGKVLAVDAPAGLVVLGLSARHGVAKGMTFTVSRGSQPVCSLVILYADETMSVARVVELSARVPPAVGDVAFFIGK